MSTGHFWDGTGSGNPKHSEKNVYVPHYPAQISYGLGWDLTRVST